ncbi:hypothetical protein Dip518_000368 [Parelusimicrobium proximum]|uniref:hypothetical protein n=1 Tax=Parelusimicrobium proximum TaxID=3228953 RepID=UPI003D167675
MRKITALFALCLLVVSANAETISFATYYPVPYAEYPQVTVVENSSLVEKGGTFTSKDFNVGVRTDAQKNLTATTLDGTKTGTNAIATIADPAKTKIRGDLEVTTFDVTQTALTGNGSNKGVAKAYLENLYIYGKLFPDPAKVSGATAMEWSNIKFYVDGGTYQRDFLKLITGTGGTVQCKVTGSSNATASTTDTCNGDRENMYAALDKACTDVYKQTNTTGTELGALQMLNQSSNSDQGYGFQSYCDHMNGTIRSDDPEGLSGGLANTKVVKTYTYVGTSPQDQVSVSDGAVWDLMKAGKPKQACEKALSLGVITGYNTCLIYQHSQNYAYGPSLYYGDVLACGEAPTYEEKYYKRTISCDSGGGVTPTPQCPDPAKALNCSGNPKQYWNINDCTCYCCADIGGGSAYWNASSNYVGCTGNGQFAIGCEPVNISDTCAGLWANISIQDGGCCDDSSLGSVSCLRLSEYAP